MMSDHQLGVEEDQNGESKLLLSPTFMKSDVLDEKHSKVLPDSTPGTYMLQEAIDHLGFGKFQVKLLLILGFSVISDGMEILIVAVLGPVLQCEWLLSDLETAFITTAVFLGMVVASSFVGKIIDYFGRKKGILLAVTWGAYFSILSSVSPSYPWMLIMRILVGFSLSCMLQILGYSMELLPTVDRRFVMCFSAFWTIGGLFATSVGFFTIHYLNWRYYAAISAIPMVISILLISWLPESPRFLLMIGKWKEAVLVLERISKENQKPLPEGRLHVTEKTTNRGKIMDLFDTEFRFTTILIIYLWFTCGFAYYGVILVTAKLYHSPKGSCSTNSERNVTNNAICYNCSPLTNQDYLDLLWTALSELPGAFWTFLMADRLGRKKIMGSNFFIASLFFLLLLLCSPREVTMIFIFIARATIFGAILALDTYTPELYPTHLRGTAIGFFNTCNRIGGTTTPFLAQVLLDESLQLTVLIYSAFLILASIISMLLPVETKLRPLDTKLRMPRHSQ